MSESDKLNSDLGKNNIFTVDSPQYKRSKEDVWNDISSKIDDTNIKDNVNIRRNLVIFYSIAASLIVFLGTILMMRFYSESIYCPEGQQITEALPDGSIITLQPNTTVTYYPLWWRYSRRLVLSGEAFFDVKKGNDFMVSSPMGTTSVLGTSFTIQARSNTYIVTCFTGRVHVVSYNKRSVVLDADFTAELVDGDIKVTEYHGSKQPESINSMMFDYTSVPLEMVIEDMEKHFDIIVTSEVPLGYNYTGYFSKRKSIDEVLYILLKPYGLKSVKLSDKKYHIIKN